MFMVDFNTCFGYESNLRKSKLDTESVDTTSFERSKEG